MDDLEEYPPGTLLRGMRSHTEELTDHFCLVLDEPVIKCVSDTFWVAQLKVLVIDDSKIFMVESARMVFSDDAMRNLHYLLAKHYEIIGRI